jgi:hypothetical protein
MVRYTPIWVVEVVRIVPVLDWDVRRGIPILYFVAFMLIVMESEPPYLQ